MQLVRALYDYGILRNDQVEINGKEIGIMDCIAKYLLQSKEGQETEIYGYALHVEVIGMKNNEKQRRVLYPYTPVILMDLIVGWEKLKSLYEKRRYSIWDCYRANHKGNVNKVSVVTPEELLSNHKLFLMN